jgi:hypothetical protein
MWNVSKNVEVYMFCNRENHTNDYTVYIFEVIMAVNMKIDVARDVMPCSIEVCRRLRGT